YLKASPEVLFHHLSIGKGVRPLLLDKTPEEVQTFIREQLELREPYYSQARHTLDVNLMDDYEKVALSVGEIRRMLNV
ncbi:MAG: shikimate kinase, partial [Prevotella sp.]|nr:shikimate kinase [Prevotella sp.]